MDTLASGADSAPQGRKSTGRVSICAVRKRAEAACPLSVGIEALMVASCPLSVGIETLMVAS
jgi:hypothetical protein